MRVVLLGMLVAAGCVVGDATDDYSDTTWSQADDSFAVSAMDESAAGDEDVTEPPVATDDSADPAEVDDVAPDVAPLVATATEYRNPVGPGCPDPGVIRVDGANGPTFYAACTGNGFPMHRSTDLVHWQPAGHIFTTETKPKWGGGNWWAPEIHHVDGGYVAYFVALSPSRGKMCIGAARATSVAGPWHDIGRPLVCNAHVSLIDPNAIHFGDHLVLYYKTDSNALSPKEHTIIYAQELASDGVTKIGQRHRMLENTLGWEGDVTEAPWVKQRGGYYYMFYSGHTYCNASYAVGVARARSPLGPFLKRSQPILHSSSAFTGPGHNSVVTFHDHDWIVYHAYPGAHACGETTGARQLMIDRITWQGGWPSVHGGTPTTGLQPLP